MTASRFLNKDGKPQRAAVAALPSTANSKYDSCRLNSAIGRGLVPAPVPFLFFGTGSRHSFSWYFEGPSRVEVSSIEEVERWLLGCTSASDKELFDREDHWQHPGEFELIRMGDCDDHALWAWRKLVELGFSASLVTGKWRADTSGGHVWLLLTIDGEDFIFEATSKVLGEALRPLDEVRDDYRPHFSVDEHFQTRAYLGSAQGLFDW